MVGGSLVATAVPIPLAVGVGITEHDGQAVVSFGQGVQDHAEAQAGDTDRIAAAQPLGGDRLRVWDGQVDTQPVGRASNSRGQPGQSLGGFRPRRGAHSVTPDVGAG